MRRILLFILLTTFITDLSSQPCSIIIEESFDSIPFVEFVRHVENNYSMHFYLKRNWIDTLYISHKEKFSSLREILDESLKETNLSYYIYNCNKVIIPSE